jgi:hypothetical protein
MIVGEYQRAGVRFRDGRYQAQAESYPGRAAARVAAIEALRRRLAAAVNRAASKAARFLRQKSTS